jgi:hypothetical protein
MVSDLVASRAACHRFAPDFAHSLQNIQRGIWHNPASRDGDSPKFSGLYQGLDFEIETISDDRDKRGHDRAAACTHAPHNRSRMSQSTIWSAGGCLVVLSSTRASCYSAQPDPIPWATGMLLTPQLGPPQYRFVSAASIETDEKINHLSSLTLTAVAGSKLNLPEFISVTDMPT